METTLDKFGRVVIPKQLREDLGLRPGALLKIKQEEEKISIELIGEEPQLVVKKNVLVYQGTATGDIEGALTNHRQKRLSKIGSGH